jgi:hypothetical protein
MITMANTAKAFADLEIYMNAEPAGVIGPEYPMYYPLFLDLQSQPIIEVGSETYSSHQGADFLGIAYRNQNFKLILLGLKVGNSYNIKINFKKVGGEDIDKIKYFNAVGYKNRINGMILSKLQYDVQENAPYVWEIKFIASKVTEEIFIKHLHVSYSYLYLNVEKFSLSES